ncbi:uncharacterized protein LOC144454007 [Glandiceps talaboti]
MEESEVNLIIELVNQLTFGQCKDFVRSIGLSDVIIDEVYHDNPHDTREQKYKLLQECVKMYGEAVYDKFKQELKNKSNGKCYGVDLLSMQYVDRPLEIKALLGLLTEGNSTLVGIIDEKGASRKEKDGDQYVYKPDPIGIRGFGGIGKTTIAKALAQKVCKELQMDVVWLTISKNSDILRSFNVLHDYLMGKRENFPDIRAGQDWLRSETEGRKMLLILDDVWNEKDVIPFNVLGPNCRLLITTRHERVLTYNKAKIHPLGTLDSDQSRDMLLNYANVTRDDIIELHLGKTFGEIQSILKNLPLAIALIGSALRQSSKPKDLSRVWERTLHKLKLRSEFWKKKLTTESYSYSLNGAFDVSFEYLTEGEFDEDKDTTPDCSMLQSRFLDFALFAEDTEIPADVLMKLWRQDNELSDDGDHSDDFDFQDNFQELKDSSLIHGSSLKESGEESYTLHDLVLKYAIYKFEAVHGKGSLQKRHRDLLRCYSSETSYIDQEKELGSSNQSNFTSCTPLQEDGRCTSNTENQIDNKMVRWWCIDNDGYIYLYLFHHLMNAGYEQVANKLLLQYKWIKKKLRESDIAAVIADFEYYLHQFPVNKSSLRNTANSKSSIESIELIYQSLNFTARIIAKDTQQLPVQLLGSLIEVQNSEILDFVHEIQKEKILANKHALIPLTPCLTQPGGYLKRSIPDNKATVLCVAFTHDNKRIIAGLGTGGYKKARVLIIDRETGRESILGKEVDHHDGLVFGLAVHPKDYFVITASFDKTLKVWPLDNEFESVSTLTGHVDDIYCVALSPDGSFAVSGSADETIKKWDLGNKTCCLSMSGHKGTVRQVCITKSGDKAISGSEDGNVRIWCLKTGNLQIQYESMVGSVRQIAITHDDSRVITVGMSEHAKILDLADGKVVRELAGHGCEIICCAVTKDDSHVFTGAVDGIIRMWSLHDDEGERIFQGHAQRVRYIGISSDGNTMASGSEDCSLKVWDCNPTSTKHITTQRGHIAAVSALAVMQDGGFALSASHDNTLKLWELPSYKSIHIFRGHTDKINCLTISETLCYGISGSSDKSIGIWDLRKRTTHHKLMGHKHAVTAILSANLHGNDILVSGSIDNSLLVWDIQKLVPVCRLISDFYDVKHIHMTAEYQVTAVFQESASVWNMSDEMLVGDNSSQSQGVLRCVKPTSSTMPSFQQSFPIIARSDRNGFIVGWDEMSRIRKWDLDNEIEAKVSSGHGDSNLVTCLCLTDDNEILLCGSESGHVNLIGLHNTERPIGQLKKPPSVRSPVTAISVIEIQPNSKGPIIMMIFTAYKNGIITCYKIDKARMYSCGCTPMSEVDGKTTQDEDPCAEKPLVVDLEKQVGKLSSAVVHLIAYVNQGVIKLLSCSDSPNVPSIILWDVDSQQKVKELSGHTNRVTSICMIGGVQILSGSLDDTVRYWNLETGECRVDKSGLCGIRCVTVTNDKQQYLVASNRNVIEVRDVTSGQYIRSIQLGSKFNMKYLSLSGNGVKILCCYDDFSSEVRNLKTGHVELSMIGHQNEWGNIAYISGNQRVFARSTHCSMKVWCRNTGEVLGYIGRHPELDSEMRDRVSVSNGHSRMVTAVKVHDGKLVLTGSYDKTVKLWTMEESQGSQLRFCLVNTFYFEHAVTAIEMYKDDVVCVGLLNGLVCFLKLNT